MNKTTSRSILIIAILLATAAGIPVYMNARAQSAKEYCLFNLKLIASATEAWALANNKRQGDTVEVPVICLYIKTSENGKLPDCPAGGKYTVPPLGKAPSCSIHGHMPNESDWTCGKCTMATNQPPRW